MPVKFLTVSQALDHFEQFDVDDYSDVREIACFPPDPGIVTDEEDVREKQFMLRFTSDISGEVEISINPKSKVNEEVYELLIKKEKKRNKCRHGIIDESSDESEFSDHWNNPGKQVIKLTFYKF